MLCMYLIVKEKIEETNSTELLKKLFWHQIFIIFEKLWSFFMDGLDVQMSEADKLLLWITWQDCLDKEKP